MEDERHSRAVWELAEVNVARALAPLDSELLAPFRDRLASVNAVADASPGFRWRLMTEAGDATGVRAFEDDRVIVNLSVWADVRSLGRYLATPAHREVFRRASEWFEPVPGLPSHALWWVPAGEWPTVGEARRRLELLARQGPGPEAFDLGHLLDPPS